MNSVLDSNNNSQLLQTLWKREQSTPYEYKIIGNFCNGARTILKVASVTAGAVATPGGLELVFPIPRSSYYLQYILPISSFTLTQSQATKITSTSNFGNMLFSRVRLSSGTSTLWQSDPYNAQVRQKCEPFEIGSANSLSSQPFATFQGAATVAGAIGTALVATPLSCPFFDETYMYYDTIFQEPLELGLLVETNTNLSLTDDGITSITTHVYCFYRAVDYQSYILNKSLNFKQGMPTTILLATSLTEAPQAITNGTTSTPFYLKNKWVSLSTSFFLTDSANLLGRKAVFGSDTKNIWSFDFSFAGSPIFTGINTYVLANDTGFKYNCAKITTSNAGALSVNTPLVGPHTIYWSDDPRRTFNSHALAYYNGGQPILTAYHSNPAATTYSLNVNHEVFQFYTVDSSNGIGQISYAT